MWKNVHPVSGARIQTNNLLITSLLPEPLDQGSRPMDAQKIIILFGQLLSFWLILELCLSFWLILIH